MRPLDAVRVGGMVLSVVSLPVPVLLIVAQGMPAMKVPRLPLRYVIHLDDAYYTYIRTAVYYCYCAELL